MDAASVGFAVLDLCLKAGKKLHQFCQTYRSADRKIRESILHLEGIWLKTEDQIETLRAVWENLDARFQVHQNLVLSVLYEKLQLALTIIEGLSIPGNDDNSKTNHVIKPQGSLNKFKYAVFDKRKIEGIVQELDQWHRRFDPSWYLLARVTACVIDAAWETQPPNPNKALTIIQNIHSAHQKNDREAAKDTSSIFLPHEYPIQDRAYIPNTYSETALASTGPIIVDTLQIVEGRDDQVATRDVRDLARVLSKVEPGVFGLLKCHGVVSTRDPHQGTKFEFVFAIPPGLSQPQNLRAFLVAQDRRYPLDGQFQLAKSLARSVLFLHSARIVHKNISPETILLFDDADTKLKIPFLVGFDKFRRSEGRTYMQGDTFWEKNLYRHPRRQGENPEEMYQMHHDIYSLGVCLLEIGMGFSFVLYEDASISDRNLKGAIPNPLLEIAESLEKKDLVARAFQIKKRLVTLAEESLIGRMGRIYTNVVLSCLTCLDPQNTGFGDESNFTDSDGILVGVRYIEKVLYEFEEIKV